MENQIRVMLITEHIETEMLEFYYDELRISLVMLSLSAERQIEITGYGCAGDEILIDFESYCIHENQILKESGYITDHQTRLLEEFNDYLKKFDDKYDVRIERTNYMINGKHVENTIRSIL